MTMRLMIAYALIAVLVSAIAGGILWMRLSLAMCPASPLMGVGEREIDFLPRPLRSRCAPIAGGEFAFVFQRKLLGRSRAWGVAR